MAKSGTDQFLGHNRLYAKGEAEHRPNHPGKQPIQPSRRVAVAGCVDALRDWFDWLISRTPVISRFRRDEITS